MSADTGSASQQFRGYRYGLLLRNKSLGTDLQEIAAGGTSRVARPAGFVATCFMVEPSPPSACSMRMEAPGIVASVGSLTTTEIDDSDTTICCADRARRQTDKAARNKRLVQGRGKDIEQQTVIVTDKRIGKFQTAQQGTAESRVGITLIKRVTHSRRIVGKSGLHPGQCFPLLMRLRRHHHGWRCGRTVCERRAGSSPPLAGAQL